MVNYHFLFAETCMLVARWHASSSVHSLCSFTEQRIEAEQRSSSLIDRCDNCSVAFILCTLTDWLVIVGTKERRIPQATSNPFTALFHFVSCPNYTYEVGSWLSFSFMSQSLPGLTISVLMMLVMMMLVLVVSLSQWWWCWWWWCWCWWSHYLSVDDVGAGGLTVSVIMMLLVLVIMITASNIPPHTDFHTAPWNSPFAAIFAACHKKTQNCPLLLHLYLIQIFWAPF